MAGIPVVAVEQRAGAKLAGSWVSPCVLVQDKSLRRIEAVAIDILSVKGNAGYAIGNRRLEQLVDQARSRRGCRDRQATRVLEGGVDVPILKHPGSCLDGREFGHGICAGEIEQE